jgi:hypothetical protein
MVHQLSKSSCIRQRKPIVNANLDDNYVKIRGSSGSALMESLPQKPYGY